MPHAWDEQVVDDASKASATMHVASALIQQRVATSAACHQTHGCAPTQPSRTCSMAASFSSANAMSVPTSSLLRP